MPKIAFGNEELEFELDPGDTLTEKEPGDVEQQEWNPESLRKRLSSADFGDFMDQGKPLIVVNDAFRPTPTGKILALLSEWYPGLKADFIVACGNHPAPSEHDIDEIFGDYQRPTDSQVFVHDSNDHDSMTEAGAHDGHPILLNKKLFDYAAVIIIGSVEPHYFAGFTGGRKSIIPGLSDIDTNRRNHALAVSSEARPLRLEGNPVAEHLNDLLDAVKLPDIFSIQIVAGQEQKILDCFVGSLSGAFSEAVSLAEQVYGFTTDKRYDLVISEMRHPLDRNLYQIQKAIENTAPAVRDGGTLLAVSRCPEGIGNDEFYQLALKFENEEMVLSNAELDSPPMGIHKLSRIVELRKRIAVRALTGIKQEVLNQIFIEPAVSIEAEIQKLKQGDKKDIDILLVRDAGQLAVKSD